MTKASGNILPLAIAMTFIVLLSGIAIGTVVLEGARRAKETDDSVNAYYMADSGIERQLYEIRKNGKTLTDVAGLASEFPNAGRWESTAALEQAYSKTIGRIPASDFATMDLFDPDALGASPDIDRIVVSWTGTGPLEVGYAQWVTGGTIIWPSDDSYVVQVGLPPAMTIAFDPQKAYRLRLRALDADATNVRIETYRAGAAQAFPGDITLGAEGTYGQSTQKMTVTMPKLDVLSGAYGFVLFSECQIQKGSVGPEVCP